MKATFSRLAMIAVIATACVQTRAIVLNPTARRAPVCAEAVIIYTAADKVGEAYDEVALLDSRGDNDMTTVDQMYNSMRKKAAQLGATGVILEETKEASTGAEVAQVLLGTAANRKGKATAIYVADDSARVAQACVGKTIR